MFPQKHLHSLSEVQWIIKFNRQRNLAVTVMY